jgi:hypothetical protein
MAISTRLFRAARLSAALAVMVTLPLAAIGGASAQSPPVDVPAYRQLSASETMAPPGANGIDASANAPSLAGLTLLATVPTPTTPRRGYFIQAQCTAGLTIAFDDQEGDLTPTIVVLAGAGVNGGQGAALDMTGAPHTGRIRIYSSSATCQMAARSW